jgi:hypothetical protein
MKKILSSLLIIGIVGALAVGLSSGFFSDTETSQDNNFTSGIFDLLIDNTSYYNGEESPNTTWTLDDLDGHLFFNFLDIKPGDEGEDTVSIHINNNDAWACYEIEITKNDDISCTANELVDDPTCNEVDQALFDGDLADQLEFFFWVDDGDNVFEEIEQNDILLQAKVSELPGTIIGTLADSDENLFGIEGDPLEGTETYFIGKAWCFGELTPNPVTGDLGQDPTVDSGILCDGSGLDNSAQTDQIMGDISFYAEQYRNNPGFQCEDAEFSSLLWIIGDEEVNQLNNAVDELNFVALGGYPNPGTYTPSYTRVVTSPIDDVQDEVFPWNTDFSNSYAKTIEIDFNSPATNALLTIHWSPGASGSETKQVYLDNVLQTTIGPLPGISDPSYWSNYPMRTDTVPLVLTAGSHTIKFEQTTGNGTVWDYIKLEKL